MSLRSRRILIWSLLGAAVVALAIPKLTGGDPTAAGPGGGRPGGAAGGPGGGGRGPGGAGGRPTMVKAVVVGQEEVADRLRVSGTVLPNEIVDLQAETAGKITGLYFREGEAVPAGKLLVKINDAELRAQLQRAEHRRTLAAAKEARQKQLLEKNAVSPADYDVALSELNTANADIELIRAQIARTEIRAPFAGMIGLRQVSPGAYISPSTRIATLSNTNPMKLEFYVPERYHSLVRPGSVISFAANGSGPMSARVYAVEPRIDQVSRTLQVRATAPNPGGRVLPGAFAQITLGVGTSQSIVVPSEAIVPQEAGQMAVYVSVDGKAEQRPVRLGLRTDRSVQILEGLQAGDTVIYSGVQMVKPGGVVKVAVRPIEAN